VTRSIFLGLLLTAGPPDRLTAQIQIHAQAIPLLTRAWHTPGDKALSEFALVQPALMLEWEQPMSESMEAALHFSARLTLDGEGLTIPDGELAPGDYGEGFYDRRHPHTYVHELMLSGSDLLGRHDGALQLSLSAGKGFVAFGSDDPMSRPVVRYPVDHHLAQILERGVVIGRASYGPVALEVTGFDGDEPTKPSDWPNLGRGLDSKAVRFTVTPVAGVEAQYSWARVKSPEHRDGAGTTQRKRSASLRWNGPLARRPTYALLEWARTDEAGGFFVFHALVAEGAMSVGRSRPYFRFERTNRPEDTRTTDPFRSVRPPLDNSLIGITRWTVWTAGYGVSFHTAQGRLELRPFVEGSLASVRATDGIFDPKSFYGADVLPSVTLGVRMDWGGMSGMRMGRYGVAGTSMGSMDH
jgi:hypothetical protein